MDHTQSPDTISCTRIGLNNNLDRYHPPSYATLTQPKGCLSIIKWFDARYQNIYWMSKTTWK